MVLNLGKMSIASGLKVEFRLQKSSLLSDYKSK